MTFNSRQIAVASVAALAAAAFAYQAAAISLYQDGKIVSSDVKSVDGVLYVPVKDLAAYLGGTINKTADRVDITSNNPTATGTSGGQPQALANDLTPPMAQPAAVLLGSPPPPPPNQIESGLNQDIVFGDVVYRITSVTTQQKPYKQQFDQRGGTFKPQFRPDKLVIVNLTVVNKGSTATTPDIPAGADLTVFDENQVGYPTTNTDIRQTSDVLANDMNDLTMDSGSAVSILGPKGTLTYAVIGSVPVGATVKSIRFHLAPPSKTLQQPGVTYSTTPTMNNTTPQPPTPPAPPADPSQNPSGADITVNIT